MMVILLAYWFIEISEHISWIETFFYVQLLPSYVILLCVTNPKHTEVTRNGGDLGAVLVSRGFFPWLQRTKDIFTFPFDPLLPTTTPVLKMPKSGLSSPGVSHCQKLSLLHCSTFSRKMKSYISVTKYWSFSNLLQLL